MKIKIGELTNIVLSLTEMLSSNIRERKELNVVSTESNSRCDMVTGVHNPQQPFSRTSPSNGTPRNEPATRHLTYVMTEIYYLRSSMGGIINLPKIRKPKCRCSKETEV